MTVMRSPFPVIISCLLDGIRISTVRQVEFLQGCPLLHTLVLEGNPMDRLVEYRARVIFRLQGLMLLDRNKVGLLQEHVSTYRLLLCPAKTFI